MHRLPALHVGSPTMAGPLTVFPVWTEAPLTPRPYLPLAEARVAVVREHDGGASVNRLTATNPAPRPVLLLEGTLFTAGMQHRVLARDVLVAPGATRDLPVACVEQGRWSGAAAQEIGRTTAPLAVRGALRSIRRPDHAGRPVPNDTQNDVWTRVRGYERRFGSSDTSSLVDVHRRLAPAAADVTGKVRPIAGQRGVVVGISGHPVLLEVFDDPETLAEQLPALLVAAALDALGAPFAPTPGHRARSFARRAADMRLGETLAEPGPAVVHSGRDDLIAAQALASSAHLFHASALNVRHALVLAA